MSSARIPKPARGPATRIYVKRHPNRAGVESPNKLNRIKLVSDILAAWVSVLALLAGGIFGIQQYLDKERGDRVKETLNFLDRYHQEPFVGARMDLYQTWNKYVEKENSFRGVAEFDEKGFAIFINETIKKEDLTARVDLVTDFYSALEVCIASQACDEDLAMLLFQPDATAHFNRHFPYIFSTRSDQNAWGCVWKNSNGENFAMT